MISTKKTIPHAQLEILRKRTQLTEEQEAEFERFHLGYMGENFLLEYLGQNLSSKPIILSNLKFSVRKSECQIDCLLIYQGECVLIEVKNYRSDFYVENDKWYIAGNNKEIRNPLEQANHATRMLKELFYEEGIHINVKPFVVFTNQKFLLYGAPRNNAFIFPNRLETFVKLLDKKGDYLSDWHYSVKEKLTARHVTVSTHERPIEFDTEKLRRGITCFNPGCSGFMTVVGKKSVRCEKCGFDEQMDQTIMRAAFEVHILFPDEKITVRNTFEWIAGTLSIEKIRKTFLEHCIRKGRGKNTYYDLRL